MTIILPSSEASTLDDVDCNGKPSYSCAEMSYDGHTYEVLRRLRGILIFLADHLKATS